MATSKIDPLLLADIEERAAIGTGYDRLIAEVQEAHHERAKEVYRKRNGLEDWENVDDLVPMPRGASPRTIDRYLKSIRERWVTEEIEMRPKRREELRQKIQASFLKSYHEGGASMGAAVRCLALFAKIDGLEAPQEVNVNTTTVNIKAMSPDERVARLRQLHALRQKAVAEGRVIDILPAPEAKKLPKKTPAKKAKPKPKKRLKRPRKKTSK